MVARSWRRRSPSLAGGGGIAVQARLLENDIAYLRVSDAGKNLADEISAAEGSLAVSNKTIGTVLDLRSASGDGLGGGQVGGGLFYGPQIAAGDPGRTRQTRDAADKLAVDLRTEQAGLIFGTDTPDLRPDIAVSVKTG